MKRVMFVAVLAVVLVLAMSVPALANSQTFVSEEGIGIAVVGPINAYATPDDMAWFYAISNPAQECYVHPSWPQEILGSSAEWISNYYYTDGPSNAPLTADQWRLFRIPVQLPGNAINVVGTLKINSDNAERVWVNDTYIGEDGDMEGIPWTDPSPYAWSTIQTYNISALQAGMNYMDVIVRNYAGSNSSTANPTGLIYDLTVTYDLGIDVDIKPGSDPSSLNWDGHGKVPIAILGSADFDVTTIDPMTVEMNGAGAALKGKKDPTAMASYSDVNGDGYIDLVVQIQDTDEDVVAAGSTWVRVTCRTYDGIDFVGIGDINLVPATG